MAPHHHSDLVEQLRAHPTRIVRPGEIREILGVSSDRLHRLADTGVIRSHRVGARRVFVAKDILAFIDGQSL